MIVFPNAKINLGLRILRKRPDGFHDLETIFYPVGWCDILEVLPSDRSRRIWFRTSGLPLPGTTKDNLVIKAATLMQKHFGLPGLKIHLHKQIPAGAGLGGGSSDAVFTIKALQRLFSLNISFRELQHMAGQLGSDCPFFLKNKPVLAFGKGEILTPLNLNLRGKYILIIYPGFMSDTRKMYRKTPLPHEGKSLKETIDLPLHEWKKYLTNAFEKVLSKDFPIIPDLLKQLYENGAWYAALSGSGSSVFGLFDTPPSFTFPEKYLIWSGRL